MYTKERRGRRRRIRRRWPLAVLCGLAVLAAVLFVLRGRTAGGQAPDRESALCVVCIDPGHGGSDQGTSWEGRLEKEDNLDMALALQRALEARNIYVVLTREDDTSLTLEERVAFAQAEQADYYISLHRNYADVSACGIEIWRSSAAMPPCPWPRRWSRGWSRWGSKTTGASVRAARAAPGITMC